MGMSVKGGPRCMRILQSDGWDDKFRLSLMERSNIINNFSSCKIFSWKALNFLLTRLS